MIRISPNRMYAICTGTSTYESIQICVIPWFIISIINIILTIIWHAIQRLSTWQFYISYSKYTIQYSIYTRAARAYCYYVARIISDVILKLVKQTMLADLVDLRTHTHKNMMLTLELYKIRIGVCVRVEVVGRGLFYMCDIELSTDDTCN